MWRYSLFAAKKRPLLTNMVLNLLLIVPLAHAGLAPASSISALINAGLLFAGLYRLKVYHLTPS